MRHRIGTMHENRVPYRAGQGWQSQFDHFDLGRTKNFIIYGQRLDFQSSGRTLSH